VDFLKFQLFSMPKPRGCQPHSQELTLCYQYPNAPLTEIEDTLTATHGLGFIDGSYDRDNEGERRSVSLARMSAISGGEVKKDTEDTMMNENKVPKINLVAMSLRL
jgi:hypothetical protein